MLGKTNKMKMQQGSAQKTKGWGHVKGTHKSNREKFSKAKSGTI